MARPPDWKNPFDGTVSLEGEPTSCTGFCDSAGNCACAQGCATDKDRIGGACTWPGQVTGPECQQGLCENQPVPGSLSDNTLACVCPAPECPTGSTCREAAGLCDVAEKCDANNACPTVDEFVAAGTVCRTPSRSCERYSTCDGKSSACRHIIAPNGEDCLYALSDDNTFFWPMAEANIASYGDSDREQYERNPYGGRWPLCYGKCSGGACVLNKSRPGCCYLSDRRGYGQSAELSAELASTAYSPKNLMCWEGTRGY